MARSHEILVNEIVENLDLLYCFVGSDLKYKAFNRRQADFIKLLHGTEIIREENYLSFITSDSDRRIVEENLRRALAGEVFTAEHFFGLDGGICKCLEAVHCPIRDANKKIIAWPSMLMMLRNAVLPRICCDPARLGIDSWWRKVISFFCN